MERALKRQSYLRSEQLQSIQHTALVEEKKRTDPYQPLAEVSSETIDRSILGRLPGMPRRKPSEHPETPIVSTPPHPTTA